MSAESRGRFRAQLRALGFRSYDEYLASDHWRDLKTRFYRSKLFTGACFACGGGGPFAIHHRTYKRLGREWLMDLVAVCGGCHLEAHELERSTASSRITLWNAVKRVRARHAGRRRLGAGHTAPSRGTVRADRRSPVGGTGS